MLADFAIHVHKMRVQLALAGALVFATGWTVGVSKFSQVLMTSAGGKFETASEQRAESFLITFGLAKAVGNLLVGAAAWQDRNSRLVVTHGGMAGAADEESASSERDYWQHRDAGAWTEEAL